MGYKDFSVGDVENVAQHLAFIGGIHWNEHGSQIVDSEEGQNCLFAIKHPYRNMIATTYSLLVEASSKLSHLFAQLFVGPNLTILKNGEGFSAFILGKIIDQISSNAALSWRYSRIKQRCWISHHSHL